MKRVQPLTLPVTPLVLVMILMCTGSVLAASSTPWVIHSFAGGTADGSGPFAGLVADSAGNLYGTTYDGGNSPICYSLGNTGCGTVFKLIRPTTPGGTWTETVLYSFQAGTDGYGPLGGVIFDQAGNLYGTTNGGGENPTCPNCGTVFELSPPATAGGTWTETVLYRFQGNGQDGAGPMGSLVFDKAGNLYGTTFVGGIYIGTVFQLGPPSSPGDPWTETVIYSFKGGADGSAPESGLIIDAEGVLYGTTSSGGDLSCDPLGGGCGVVFRVVPPTGSGGAWSEHVLYAFGTQPHDARYPSGTLVFDVAGNLYGTANGGTRKLGAIFELIRPVHSRGAWTETVLYEFVGGTDGSFPQNNLTFDSQGALYGVTVNGGGGTGGGTCLEGCGTVFKLLPPAPGGTWAERVLHRFGFQSNDGIAPTLAGLVRDGNTFYGTTTSGGGDTSTCPFGCGTVFKFDVSW